MGDYEQLTKWKHNPWCAGIGCKCKYYPVLDKHGPWRNQIWKMIPCKQKNLFKAPIFFEPCRVPFNPEGSTVVHSTLPMPRDQARCALLVEWAQPEGKQNAAWDCPSDDAQVVTVDSEIVADHLKSLWNTSDLTWFDHVYVTGYFGDLNWLSPPSAE